MAGFGQVALFGSGETARSGRQVHEEVLRGLPAPVRMAILKTPAAFQPNADFVADRIRQFVERNLQNCRPQVTMIDACRKGGPGDPDDPAVYAPLAEATYILAGPGSPTFMVRHLAETGTLTAVRARWAQGARLALASAAAIAVSRYTLPVYEIYKAGEDLNWREGLDLFGVFGVEVAIMPHWNNSEGGRHLDTSHCFMGRERFERLRRLLPPSTVILGIDEHTSCIVDVAAETIRARGQGEVTVLRGDEEHHFAAGTEAPLSLLRAA
jgi:cyanophycinase-like exopeptidase